MQTSIQSMLELNLFFLARGLKNHAHLDSQVTGPKICVKNNSHPSGPGPTSPNLYSISIFTIRNVTRVNIRQMRNLLFWNNLSIYENDLNNRMNPPTTWDQADMKPDIILRT